MEFKSILVVGFALTALAFTATEPAQTYKAEYKISLVLGPAFPWGRGG